MVTSTIKKCVCFVLFFCGSITVTSIVTGYPVTQKPNPSPQTFDPLPINGTKAPGPAQKGMVWVPGGWFWMGSDDPNHPESNPIHKVYVDGFWMDKHEITNAQWAEFAKETGYKTVAEKKPDPSQLGKDADPQLIEAIKKQPPFSLVFEPPIKPLPDLKDHLQWWKLVEGADWQHPTGPKSDVKGKENHPVVHICYLDAKEFCKWRSKKENVICRLPTEAEWEFAARGGKNREKFPWGNELKPQGKWMANIWQGKFPNQNSKEDGYDRTAPVGTFPANGFGLHGMAGNVWEWCEDFYKPDSYKNSSTKNPKGPSASFDPGEPGLVKRVQRGGSFLCDASYCERYFVYARGKGEVSSAADHTGFRCVVLPQKTKDRLPVQMTEEGRKIHSEGLLIDGHNDLPWAIRENLDSIAKPFDLRIHQPKLHTDIPRLKKGNIGAQFWSAWVPASTAKKGTAVKMTLEQIDIIHRLIKQYSDVFEMADTAEEIVRIHKAGKIASMIGIEGGHSIDNSLAVLRTYYTLGARYMTLTHSESIDWADSATDEPKHGGLTDFGERVVQEMNRLGMMVDISHVSVDTMKDAIRVSKAPVIASHSSAYAVAAHPRNVPDDVLQLVKKNGGVVMVNFYSGFVVPEAAKVMKQMFKVYRELRDKYKDDKQFQEAWRLWKKANPYPRGSIHDVVDHIEHIIKVTGVDHVGLGSDFDGISTVPEQLEDVASYPLITQELLNRGYNAEQIHKILGGNMLRVMREVEAVAAKLKKGT